MEIGYTKPHILIDSGVLVVWVVAGLGVWDVITCGEEWIEDVMADSVWILSVV